jgi:hypothetical protein
MQHNQEFCHLWFKITSGMSSENSTQNLTIPVSRKTMTYIKQGALLNWLRHTLHYHINYTDQNHSISCVTATSVQTKSIYATVGGTKIVPPRSGGWLTPLLPLLLPVLPPRHSLPFSCTLSVSRIKCSVFPCGNAVIMGSDLHRTIFVTATIVTYPLPTIRDFLYYKSVATIHSKYIH